MAHHHDYGHGHALENDQSVSVASSKGDDSLTQLAAHHQVRTQSAGNTTIVIYSFISYPMYGIGCVSACDR
jgi:hypothetical protein